MKRIFSILALCVLMVAPLKAQQSDSVREVESEVTSVDTLSIKEMIQESMSAEPEEIKKARFLPMHRRIDREIDKNKFVYKGEVMMGITASYGTITSDDSDFLLILEHINAEGTVATVNPFFGYVYSDNHAIGVRFGYRYIDGNIGNLGFNLGEQNDLTGSLENMSLKSDNFSFGIFHRSYVGLDKRGRFGLFAEIEAAIETGTSTFSYMSGDELKHTDSETFKAKLSFNPGVAVYIFPNVCGTLSFGLGGVQYSKVKQKDANGVTTGTRDASKMRFRLNLADINIGVTIHLWDKKKR